MRRKPRKVEIPVDISIRDQIRILKGDKTYDQFFVDNFDLHHLENKRGNKK